MEKNLYGMELTTHWLDIFNLISGVGNWKQRYKLDLRSAGSMDGDENWRGGGKIWLAGNCNVVLLGTLEENVSILNLQTIDNLSPNEDALKIWDKLRDLLSKFEKQGIDKRNKIKLPTRPTELGKWRNRYKYVGQKWNSGVFSNYAACIKYLEKHHPGLACNEKTLRDNIAAGNAQMLS